MRPPSTIRTSRVLPDQLVGVIDLDLFVLSADGTETRLTRGRGWGTGSISPDGPKVIYDANLPGEKWQSGIYVVGADGGSPRLLLASGPRNYPDGTFTTAVASPTFSPDGTQIAYVDGMGDVGQHSPSHERGRERRPGAVRRRSSRVRQSRLVLGRLTPCIQRHGGGGRRS